MLSNLNDSILEAAETLSDQELIALAPRLYKELSRDIHIRSLIRLSAAFGGTDVYVPRVQLALDRSALLRVLTNEELKALSGAFGGEHLSIPVIAGLRKGARRKAIVALKRSGLSSREVALQFGMTQRAVDIIWAKRPGHKNELQPKRALRKS